MNKQVDRRKKRNKNKKKKKIQKGKNTQPPFNPSVGSLCHFYATALCGTTGIKIDK
jgi:hypothetical protein